MEGLILAAGNGSRMSSGNSAPICKALIDVNGTPLISYSLENLNQIGIKSATIVVGRKHKEEIISELGYTYKSIALQYSIQKEPLGLANAIISARDNIREDFILQLSDEIFLNKMFDADFVSKIEKMDYWVGYTIEHANRIKLNYSIETDKNKCILRCIEKPRQITNNMKGTGFCCFSYNCYHLLINSYNSQKNYPFDLCDFINLLVDNQKKGKAIQIAKEEINVNTPNDLIYAKHRLKQEGDLN